MILMHGIKAAFAAFFMVSVSLQAATLSTEQKKSFSAIYSAELGKVSECSGNTQYNINFCASSLKNEHNGPAVLLPKGDARGAVVLLHGLSDSPYFMRSIGGYLQQKNYLVILGLNPGHGKKVAIEDMRDDTLQQRWYTHFDELMGFAKGLDLPIFVGGFSTGGALASQYALNHSEEVQGLLLFSGALSLSTAAEALSHIWGIKTLAKWIDGEYQTMGPHPHKYPKVAGFSALVLLDVIHDVRDTLERAAETDKAIQLSIFAAHSMADIVTPFEGIESLVNAVKGEHVLFKIDESYDLCHADLPMSQIQLIGLKFDRSQVNEYERCAVPRANPLHAQMLLMLDNFLSTHLPKS